MPRLKTHSTTILTVRHRGRVAIGGDGQVTLGTAIMKPDAMKIRRLAAVTREGIPLDPQSACLRGFGYFISIAPLMLGFIWALVDPEHLTWADKVSGTFLKKV